MRLRDFALISTAIGAGMLVFGALVESKRLVLERHTLRLKGWPESKRGYRIAVLSDFHLRNRYSVELATRAVIMALVECPDMIVLPGDFVDQWRPGVAEMVADVLEPLQLMDGNAIAVPGNHDYELGDAGLLRPIFDEVGIHLLRNEVLELDGIQWVGIDSALEEHAHVDKLDFYRDGMPAIAVWHEPDVVGLLPSGCVLQISGHTHGGQFRFPGGFTPMHSDFGRKYPRGWYPDAPTPLYVSRGIGTTGPPSRFNCPPEVTLLTLEPSH